MVFLRKNCKRCGSHLNKYTRKWLAKVSTNRYDIGYIAHKGNNSEITPILKSGKSKENMKIIE